MYASCVCVFCVWVIVFSFYSFFLLYFDLPSWWINALIDDLDVNIENILLKFADETKLFVSITSSGDQLSMQNDLSNSLSWSVDWQMLFNIDKCKVMHFGCKNTLFSYQLEVKCLEKVSEEKDLGAVVYWQRCLKVSKHCSQAYVKANKLLGVINRTIVYKSTDLLLQFYKSIVCLHLEYCTSAWSPHYNKDKQLLEKIQRRFTRMLPGMKELPYTQHSWKLGLWSHEARRYRSGPKFTDDLRTTLRQFSDLR